MIHVIKNFVSQYDDNLPEDWRYRACGIASLKMLMDYWQALNEKNKTITVSDLLTKGLEIGAYQENVGWKHAGLVEIAKKFGYGGYNKDLARLPVDKAWHTMIGDLQKYPLIVSVYKNFEPEYLRGHLVVLAGIANENACIYDPIEESPELGFKKIAKEKFINGWKKRYIAIFPPRNK